MSIRRWEIYRAVLDPVIGSEQGKTRPVLVISEDMANAALRVVNVLPITSRKPGRRIYGNEALLPAGAGGLPNESIVLAYQIRTLNKQRLTTRFGQIRDPQIQAEIAEALALQLGL
jgi:mRNA interferase MazF